MLNFLKGLFFKGQKEQITEVPYKLEEPHIPMAGDKAKVEATVPAEQPKPKAKSTRTRTNKTSTKKVDASEITDKSQI